LTKYWERVRHSEKQILEDLFATIITDSHYQEKLSGARDNIIPSRSKENEKLEEYLIKIIKNIRDYYLEGGKAGLRNVFMNKEYAKEALKPYLRDIKIEEILITDTKTEENKELTKMIIGTLMYLVTGSADDSRINNFSFFDFPSKNSDFHTSYKVASPTICHNNIITIRFSNSLLK
jgi:hypothetical protein